MTTSFCESAKEEAQSEEDGCHYVCCFNNDVAMCGVDVSGVGFVEPWAYAPMCSVCDTLDGTDWCPIMPNHTCPKYQG